MTTDNTDLSTISSTPAANATWQQRAVPSIAKKVVSPAPRDNLSVVVCPACGDDIVKSRLFEFLYVCPHCDGHLKMSAR
ncbi:MAG TPA: hypothetical protein VIH30_02845, partial [Aquirhabdus sp.]